jgi:hypothetical protein
MGSSRPQRPSPAFVLAAISLFISLTGGAYAVSLGRGVVTARSIKTGAVKTAKIADGAVTTVKLADGSVATVKLADGSVATGKLADGSVATGKIVDSAVTSSKLAANAVNSGKVADGSLTGLDIASGAITGLNILDGSIGSGDLGTGSVGTSELAAGAVTPAKVATIPTARVRRTSGQSIATNTTTAIAFNTETWDTASLHSTASNTSRLTAPIDGVYLITASVLWQGSNVGTRNINIEINGIKAVAGGQQTPPDANQFPQSATTVYNLSAGDFAEVEVTQDRGSNLSIDTVSANELSPEFSMTWLGPA